MSRSQVKDEWTKVRWRAALYAKAASL